MLKAFWTLSASGELWQHGHQFVACSAGLRHRRFHRAGAGPDQRPVALGERLLDTSIQMLRNVPHLALIPLVILWFGIDESAKIFLVALGTMFPIYINTARHPQYRSRAGGNGA